MNQEKKSNTEEMPSQKTAQWSPDPLAEEKMITLEKYGVVGVE